MDQTVLILEIIIIIIAIIALLLLFAPNMFQLPTPTPPATPTPTTPTVTITFTQLNGSTGTVTLPQQAGTTIVISKGTPLYISGTAQPNQTVTLYIFAPNGQMIYQQSTVANQFGQFSMVLPSSNATPNVLFKISFNLGSNYYFYAYVVST